MWHSFDEQAISNQVWPSLQWEATYSNAKLFLDMNIGWTASGILP